MMKLINVFVGMFIVMGIASASMHVNNFNVDMNPEGMVQTNSMSDLNGTAYRATESFGSDIFVELYNKGTVPLEKVVVRNTHGLTFTKYAEMESGFTVYETDYEGFVAIKSFLNSYTVVVQGTTLEQLFYALNDMRVDLNHKEDLYVGSNYMNHL